MRDYNNMLRLMVAAIAIREKWPDDLLIEILLDYVATLEGPLLLDYLEKRAEKSA